MARRGFPSYAELSPEQQAIVRASRDGAPVVDVGLRGHKPSRSPHTGKGAKKGMSALEVRFGVFLERLKLAGEVKSYAYELARVVLNVRRSTKNPDFWVRCATWRPDGDLRGYDPLVVVEVKPTDKRGKPYLGAKGSLPFKLGAERLAEIGVPVFMAWLDDEYGWRFKRVEVQS